MTPLMSEQRVKWQIATADKAPLYFPLYLAHERGFASVPPRYAKSTIIEAPRDVNGDKWALDKLVNRSAGNQVMFAVCDPVLTESYRGDGVNVIATIVSKAAFWLLNHHHRINSEKDFGAFEKLYTYPKEMSAYWIAKLAEEKSNRTDMVQPVKRGDECTKFRDDTKSAAMTADIVTALGLTIDDGSIVYSWAKHPEYSNFMLSSLITTEEILAQHPDLVDGVLRGLVKANHEIQYLHTDQHKDFARIYDTGDEIAQRVLRQLSADTVFPASIVPTMSSWHSAYRIYASVKGRDFVESEATDRFQAMVKCESARKIEAEVMSNLLNLENGVLTAKVEQDIAELRNRLSQLELQEDIFRIRNRFVITSLLLAVSSEISFLVGISYFPSVGKWARVGYDALLLLGVLFLLIRRGKATPEVLSWQPFKRFRMFCTKHWYYVVIPFLIYYIPKLGETYWGWFHTDK